MASELIMSDKKPMEALITGGCGFIGSNFVRYILKSRKDVKVINIDNLTYAGNLANLADVERDYPDRYTFVKGDIVGKEIIHDIFEKSDIKWVVHFAAESHVDRSVLGPEIFVRTNILGTFNLLESARIFWPMKDPKGLEGRRFLHISTDEVYGSLGKTGYFTENPPMTPPAPILPARPPLIIWSRPTAEPTACPPSSLIAPTITALINSRKN